MGRSELKTPGGPPVAEGSGYFCKLYLQKLHQVLSHSNREKSPVLLVEGEEKETF